VPRSRQFVDQWSLWASRAEKAQLSIIRSLARLADGIERETPTDPESKERAAHIRAVARDLDRGEAVTPPQRREPIVARQLSMLD
jgi:hypothetical protein